MDKGNSKTIISILGLLGGILGFYNAIMPVVIALGHAQKVSDIWQVRYLGFIILFSIMALIFAIMGITGAVVVKSKNKISGLMMLVSAFGGIISAYILTFIFLFIAGILNSGMIHSKEQA